MALLRLFYHINWSTKNRQPVISPEIEGELHGLIAKKAIRLGGIVYAIGGIENHVHLAVTIPPTITIAKFIGQVKAVSSVRINQTGQFNFPFRWQSGYAIFTFRESGLTTVVNYINNLKQHHSKGSIDADLEKLDKDK